MVKCGHWKKCFLVSLGIHGLVIVLILCFGFQTSPAKMNNIGEINIQLINSSETSMQSNGDLSENPEKFSTSVASKSVLGQKEACAYNIEKKEKFIVMDKGSEVNRVEKTAANYGGITGNSGNTSEAAGINTSGEARTGNQSLGRGTDKGISNNGNFVANGDGSYTALNAEGISYTIIRDADAKYPEEARSIGYSRVVSVQAKILVGLDGFVEDVEILNSIPNLGFRESAIQALRKMQFAPIYYKSQNIKMYFTKKIYFQS